MNKGNGLGGRVVVITGAAQGIGAEYAVALAEQGALVAAVDVKSCSETVARVSRSGGSVVAFRTDITRRTDVESMVESLLSSHGRIDILVNNAAIVADLDLTSIIDLSSEQWSSVMNVNALGTFECLRAVGKAMLRAGSGKIINIASSTFFRGTPLMAHYVASKGAVIGLTRTAAREFGPHGVTVNCIAPGLTMTPVLQEKGVFSAQIQQSAIQGRALPREQCAGDLVGTLLFLASPASDFMTGQTLVVDGGANMQ